MSESVGSVSLDLKLNSNNVENEIKDVGTKSGGIFSSIFSSSSSKGVTSAVSAVKGAVLGLGATIASGGGLFALADSAVTAGDSVYKLSQKMHLSTDQASLLNKEMNLSGTDSQAFISAMTKIDKSIETAGKSGNTTTKSLAEFGVKLTDNKGKLLPMNEQLAALAAGYQKAAASGNEEAYSAQILGTKGIALTGILADYNDIAKEASQTKGVGIDPEQAHKVAMEITTLKTQVGALGTTVGTAVMPIISQNIPALQTGLAGIATDIKSHQSQIQSFAGIIGGILKNVLSGVGSVFNFVTSHGPLVVGVVGTIVGIMAAWKVAVTVMTAVQEVHNALLVASAIATGVAGAGQTALATATGGTALAQGVLNLAFLACPITWIVLGIAAVIAVIVLLATHWGQVTAFLMSCWATVTAFLVSGWAVVTNFFAGIPAWWNGIWTQVGQFFTNCWNGIISFFTTTIPAWIQAVIVWFNQLPYKIGLAIGQVLADIVNFGVNAFKWVTVQLPIIINGIITWFSQLPGKIWAFLVDVVTKIGQWGANMMSVAAVEIPKLISSVSTFFSELPGKIWTFLADVVSKVLTWCGNLVTTATTEIPKFISSILGFMAELPKDMLDIGTNIVKGIWSGISGAASWLGDQIKSFCSGIVDGFKKSLKIHSPSQLFSDVIGKNLALGIGQGFTENMGAVVSSMTAAIPTSFDSLVSVGSTSMAGAAAGSSTKIINLGGVQNSFSGNGYTSSDGNKIISSIDRYLGSKL